MARGRTTVGKLQRDREKQARAKAKAERKRARAEQIEVEKSESEPAPEVDQEKVLAELAALHEAYGEGKMSLDDFEARRAELTSSLRID